MASLISRLSGSMLAFPLAALTALAMFFISETSYQEAKSSLDHLGARDEARTRIQSLWRGLAEAESSQRGYLLTGRPEYLQPYQVSVPLVNESVSWLGTYYEANPKDRELMAQVARLTAEKMSEVAETLKRYDAGGDRSWHELLLSDIGKEKMQAVRDLTARLLEIESARLVTGRLSVYQTLMLSRLGVSAMTALSLLALLMYLRQTSQIDRERIEQQRVIQVERDRLEAEVTARTVQLKELAQHLQTVREDERSHLARELHDELGALLTAAKLDAARLKSRLGATTPEVTERLVHLNEALNGGIALKRRIIEDLRPSSLSNLGLVAALEILTREYATRTEIEIRCALQPVELEAAAELTVYRLVQEALTNVAKYAHATVVDVSLSAQNGQVHVAVRDDGDGFDPAVHRASTHGLVGMRYRVEAEGGEMALTSAPGVGTVIEAWLPQIGSSLPTRAASSSKPVETVPRKVGLAA